MSTKKNDYNALTGVVVTLFGLIYTFASYKLPRASIGNPTDPIIFPMGLGLLLILTGILLFVKSDKSKLKDSMTILNSKNEKEKMVTRMVAFTCLAGVVYGLTFEHLGFVLSTFIFMMGVLWMTNRSKWLTNSIVSVVFSVSIFAIFNYALGIPLPGLPF